MYFVLLVVYKLHIISQQYTYCYTLKFTQQCSSLPPWSGSEQSSVLFVIYLCCCPRPGQQTRDQGWSWVVRSVRMHQDWTPRALKLPAPTPQSDNWRSGVHRREWWRPATHKNTVNFPRIPYTWKDIEGLGQVRLTCSLTTVLILFRYLWHIMQKALTCLRNSTISSWNGTRVWLNAHKWQSQHRSGHVCVCVVPYWHCPPRPLPSARVWHSECTGVHEPWSIKAKQNNIIKHMDHRPNMAYRAV